jgi:rRNA maturation RNase YbeY
VTTIKKLAKRILKGEKISDYQLTFVGTSDRRIAELNEQFLRHPGPTDVISFPLGEEKMEGEIYISLERAKANAREFGVSYRSEVHRLAAHGLLHLIGYGDHTPGEKRVMTRKENFYLKQANVLNR